MKVGMCDRSSSDNDTIDLSLQNNTHGVSDLNKSLYKLLRQIPFIRRIDTLTIRSSIFSRFSRGKMSEFIMKRKSFYSKEQHVKEEMKTKRERNRQVFEKPNMALDMAGVLGSMILARAVGQSICVKFTSE